MTLQVPRETPSWSAASRLVNDVFVVHALWMSRSLESWRYRSGLCLDDCEPRSCDRVSPFGLLQSQYQLRYWRQRGRRCRRQILIPDTVRHGGLRLDHELVLTNQRDQPVHCQRRHCLRVLHFTSCFQTVPSHRSQEVSAQGQLKVSLRIQTPNAVVGREICLPGTQRASRVTLHSCIANEKIRKLLAYECRE